MVKAEPMKDLAQVFESFRRKPRKVSIRKQKQDQRNLGRDNLERLVKSFTCPEEQRHQIISGLKISEQTWKIYALCYNKFFIKAHSMKKTLGFALHVLKIREFKILKTAMTSWSDKKKCRANVTIFREAKKCINVFEIHENGSVLASEVRGRAGLIIGEDFSKNKKFHGLSKRIKEFLNLKSVQIDEIGSAVKWVAKQ